MESLLYNVSFWLMLNIFLVAAIVSLVLVNQSRSKNKQPPNSSQQIITLKEEEELFKQLLQKGEKRDAVVKVFPQVFKKICKTANVETRGYTFREVLNSGRIPQTYAAYLSSMYEVFEPVRYGEMKPTEETLAKFEESLHRLSEEFWYDG
uniref:DUF4129 domain-containing protein n=1 Tax=Caldiarchaeum subterraneum TaxID=311458 RepID=E6NA65_CALS0|nr:hypothetical protein HGMM_F32B02C16 [Candidatus Caldarchaeum subterraneum]